MFHQSPLDLCLVDLGIIGLTPALFSHQIYFTACSYAKTFFIKVALEAFHWHSSTVSCNDQALSCFTFRTVGWLTHWILYRSNFVSLGYSFTAEAKMAESSPVPWSVYCLTQIETHTKGFEGESQIQYLPLMTFIHSHACLPCICLIAFKKGYK